MSFNLKDLRNIAETRLFSELLKSEGAKKTSVDLIKENNKQVLNENKLSTSEQYHIFLSHSSKDANVIYAFLSSDRCCCVSTRKKSPSKTGGHRACIVRSRRRYNMGSTS